MQESQSTSDPSTSTGRDGFNDKERQQMRIMLETLISELMPQVTAAMKAEITTQLKTYEGPIKTLVQTTVDERIASLAKEHGWNLEESRGKKITKRVLFAALLVGAGVGATLGIQALLRDKPEVEEIKESASGGGEKSKIRLMRGA